MMLRPPPELDVGLIRVTPQLYARPPPSSIFNAPGIHCVFIDCGIPFANHYDPLSKIGNFVQRHMGRETTFISDSGGTHIYIIHPQGIPWDDLDMIEFIVQGVCFEPLTEEDCTMLLDENFPPPIEEEEFEDDDDE